MEINKGRMRNGNIRNKCAMWKGKVMCVLDIFTNQKEKKRRNEIWFYLIIFIKTVQLFHCFCVPYHISFSVFFLVEKPELLCDTKKKKERREN